MKFLHFLKQYNKTIIWICIMSCLLFSPGSALPKTGLLNIPNGDKIIHFAMFGILGFIWINESKKNSTFFTYLLLFFAVLFAGLSEVIQHFFISGRTGNSLDFFADLFGLIIAIVFYYAVWIKFPFTQKISSLIFKR